MSTTTCVFLVSGVTARFADLVSRSLRSLGGLQATNPDHMPTGQRLLHVVADRMHWLTALDQARRKAQGHPPGNLSATREAA